MDINNLNWEQHKLTEKGVHSIAMPRDARDVLARAVSGGHPMIAMHKGSHIKIYIKDDGIVTTTSSGGRGRGVANFESDLRRGHRSVGKDFPRKNESPKAFQKRMAENQSNNTEQNNQGGDSEQE